MVRFCSSDPALQLASVIWAGYLSDDDSARPIAAVHDSVSSADADAGSGRERLFTGGDLTGSTPTGACAAAAPFYAEHPRLGAGAAHSRFCIRTAAAASRGKTSLPLSMRRGKPSSVGVVAATAIAGVAGMKRRPRWRHAVGKWPRTGSPHDVAGALGDSAATA